MEKVKEIELLQSLKGDTYFAQLFDDLQIDTMCNNIRNDYPIEFDVDLLKNSNLVRENTELKERLAYCVKKVETVAKDLLIKASECSDDSLNDFAECLVGSKDCLIIKLQYALRLSEKDRDTLVKLLIEN